MKKRIATLILATLLLFSSQILAAHTIELSGISRCPYLCPDNKKQPGFLLEIVRLAFKPHGISVRFIQLPWSRAVIWTRTGQIAGVIGLQRKGYLELIFPTEEQAYEQLRFFVLKNDPWRYTGLLSLRKIQIGVTQDFSYGEIDSYIKKYSGTPAVQSLPGSNTLHRNIKRLQLKRISAILEDYVVMNYTLNQMGEPGKLTEAGVLSGDNVYVAFSPKRPEAKRYADILSKAMISMRKSGELNRILMTYGLEDWK